MEAAKVIRRIREGRVTKGPDTAGQYGVAPRRVQGASLLDFDCRPVFKPFISCFSADPGAMRKKGSVNPVDGFDFISRWSPDCQQSRIDPEVT